MSTPDYSFVLTRRYPGAQWTLNANDYEQLTWLDKTAKPTQEALDAEWPSVKAEIEAEYAAKAAARKSALNKLAELGLTADEIAALVS